MNQKNSFADLAIAGAAPAFAEPLHVGRPNIGNREVLLERIKGVIDSKWLSNNGPRVQEFEREAERLLGVRHFIAMCNGTIALEIAIRAAGFQGEVILPSFTFVATAHSLQWQAITPVFCDVDPVTHNIDPGQVERLITPRTTGIIGVHVWGRPCNIGALEEIARRRGLGLLFDSAHAFGCSSGGKMIGNFGQAEVFSFHATKFLNTFEGGAVATNDDGLADRIRLMKNFGFAGYDNVIYPGTNGKMTEMSAVMGLTGLESLKEFIGVNRRNYELYRSRLGALPGVAMVEYDHSERCNYQYIVLEIDETAAGLNRDELISVCQAENILARRYFYPGCHRMEPYRSFFPNAHLVLPRTTVLASRVLVLPTGTQVEESDVETICQVLRMALANPAEVRKCIAPPASTTGEGVECLEAAAR
ncbi:MAG: DegT/DnrJ/EryC1/StrS family aminotransferase [Acidobacteriota bacterium]|nr:DegT/DnrJ/EryC1/StrS family aminotransferase [Acidobacteriota bacterium]